MTGPKLITNQIIREYDFVGNRWEHVDVFFRLHANCLHSGFLESITPVQLHTLITISLYMQENGRIEFSLAEFARSIGISLEQAERRIASLREFEFRGNRVVQIEEALSDHPGAFDTRYTVTLLPITSFPSEADEFESYSPINGDQVTNDLLAEPLRAFLEERVGLERLSEADLQFIGDLQFHPFELPSEVIEVLVEYVYQQKGRFDRDFAETIANSWCNKDIQTADSAVLWIEETEQAMGRWGSALETAVSSDVLTHGYLLQYLRERLQREPSAVQKEIVKDLQLAPYEFETGLIEVLIDYVVSQMVVRNGKPDFPKAYVQRIVHDWFEKSIKTREQALQELSKWRESYTLSPPSSQQKRTDWNSKKGAPVSSKGNADAGVAAYINRLKKAGL